MTKAIFFSILVLQTVFFGSILSAQELRPVRNNGADTLIIFVHGVRDDGNETWTNRRTGSDWPIMLLADPVFNDADIATFHYPSDVWESGGLSIGSVADNLSVLLESANYNDYGKFVFVTHSMGGLVVRSLLLKNRDFATKTPMIMFLATPSGGSNLADIASILTGDNAQIRGLQELENNNFLAEQTSAWQAWQGAKDIRSYCAFETIETSGVIVVPQASAQLLCTEKSIPVNDNHSNIVKPADENSLVYIAFKTAFQQQFDIPLFSPELNGTVIAGTDWAQAEATIKADTFVLEDDFTLLPDTYLYTNDLVLNGHRLTSKQATIVAGSIDSGIIDASGGVENDGYSLVVAAGRLSGTQIFSNGGSGQNGPEGADGQAGNRGSKGRDGSCDGFGGYRGAGRGTNGTDGSPGADGGNGTDGGNGGSVYLLTLSGPASFGTSITGGRGGYLGRGGQGGQGGQGGAGGRGCVGLGGSQSNAASGTDGLDGLNGKDGKPGVDGQPGQVWFEQVTSLEELSRLLPSSDELEDYNEKTRTEIRAVVLR